MIKHDIGQYKFIFMIIISLHMNIQFKSYCFFPYVIASKMHMCESYEMEPI